MNDEELKYDDFLNIKEENSDVKMSLSDELNKISDKTNYGVNMDNNTNNTNNTNDIFKKDIKDPLINIMRTNLLLIAIIILFVIALAKAYKDNKVNSNNIKTPFSIVKSGTNKPGKNKGNENNNKKLNFEKLSIVGEPILIIDEAERIFFVDGRVYDYDMNLLKTLTPNRKYTHYNIDGKFIFIDNKGLADEPINIFTVYDEDFNPLVKNAYSFDLQINPNIIMVKSASGTRLYTFDFRSYRDYPIGYNIKSIKNGNDIFKYVVDYEVNGIKCIDIFDGYFNIRPEVAALPSFDKLALVYKSSFATDGSKRYHGSKDIYDEVRSGYAARAYFAGTMNGNKAGVAHFYEDKVIILLVTKDNKYQVCTSNLVPLKLFDEEVIINEGTGRIFTKNGEIYDFDMNLLKKFYNNRKFNHIIVDYQVKDDEGYVIPRTRVYYIDNEDYSGNQYSTFNLYDSEFNVIIENVTSVKIVANKGIEVVKDGKTKMYGFDLWLDVIKGK